MIEVIDRDHPDIKRKPLPKYEQFVAFRFNEEKKTGKKRYKMYFSVGAVRNLNITENKYARFIDEGDRIIVWFDNNKKKGFPLKHESTKGLWIYNNSLVKKLTSTRRGLLNGDRFLIIPLFDDSYRYRNITETSRIFAIIMSKKIKDRENG